MINHRITGYLNLKMSGAPEYIPKAWVYPISVLSGTGPLCFIQMLFVFSCILVLPRKADKYDKAWVAVLAVIGFAKKYIKCISDDTI